ncbi:MAG: heterodisulfide reductase-related iron-sulfur binding cluster [Candidatus Hodarchaeota archaeon]
MNPLKYLLYLGCLAKNEQVEYEISTKALLKHFNIEVEYLGDEACCGVPAKNFDKFAWIISSARLLALASQKNGAILCLCTGCDLSFEETTHLLREDDFLRENIQEALDTIGLEYDKNVKRVHIFDVIYNDIGIKRLSQAVERDISHLKTACYYGCHAIRTPDLHRLDDSEAPTKMEELIEAIGGQTEEYPERLKCCMGPNLSFDPKPVLNNVGEIIDAIKNRGFNLLSVICPYCFKTFSLKPFPVLYLTSLIGYTVGLDPNSLGMRLNRSPIEKIIPELAELLIEEF